MSSPSVPYVLFAVSDCHGSYLLSCLPGTFAPLQPFLAAIAVYCFETSNILMAVATLPAHAHAQTYVKHQAPLACLLCLATRNTC